MAPPKTHSEAYSVNLTITDPTPPPPEPEPSTPPPPPKIKPLPKPNQEVTEPTNEPPKPVFGVTKDSVTEGDSSMVVRVGNTLMQPQEKEFTDPSLVKPYAWSEAYQQSDLDRPPKVLKMVKPEYPELAKRAGREGVVRLRFLVSKTGQVSNVKVLSAPEGLGFVETALAAVQQWRFETPTVKGRPVSAWIVQSIRFVLE
jgi:protein TonB